MDNQFIVSVPEHQSPVRLDSFLAQQIQTLSRARLQKLIAEGLVSINGHIIAQSNVKVKPLDTIHVLVPPVQESHILPEDIPLDILYEDDDILVLNKPAGIVVHPGAGNHAGTLVNALLKHCGQSLSGIGGVKRPGIVHRLDKDTSGLMVIAKNDAAHRNLVEQFQAHTIGRQYRALVWGIVKNFEGTIDKPIGRHRYQRQKMSVATTSGKTAKTDYKVIKVYPPCMSLIQCTLHSGRTHQIRVHMATLGHGVVGDPLYGKPISLLDSEKLQNLKNFLKDNKRQALQAFRLYLIHPINKKQLNFEIKDDKYISDIVSIMEKN